MEMRWLRLGKFELFMGCLGNGVTVCNKAVLEHGDYKYVAHISNAGNIKLWVPEDYIPEWAMEKIKVVAEENKANFKKDFEARSEEHQYRKILDSVPVSKLIEYSHMEGTLSDKLSVAREYYYSIM